MIPRDQVKIIQEGIHGINPSEHACFTTRASRKNKMAATSQAINTTQDDVESSVAQFRLSFFPLSSAARPAYLIQPFLDAADVNRLPQPQRQARRSDCRFATTVRSIPRTSTIAP